MAKLKYLGHSAFSLETGGQKILMDPFLRGNPLAKVKPEELQPDFILVSHGHDDHLGDAIEIAKRADATIIAPFELAMYCQNQGTNIHPMHIGGSYDFPFGRLRLTPAQHGSAVQTDQGMVYTGNPCGFVISSENKNVYFAGDTGIFYDMKLIGEMNPLDVALLPIGGNFTMDIADAVKAVELLKPRLAVPMHYNTIEVIKAEPEEFVRGCKDKGFEAKVLQVNEELEL